MSLSSDLRTLWHLAFSRHKGDDHGARLENFYGKQAGDYDSFRERLLKGRREMCELLPLTADTVWLDMGGGTGSNFQYREADLPKVRVARVIDLSPSLLKIAGERFKARGWTNADTACADVTEYKPAEGPADVITFSYSLTMIPDWFAAIDHAWRLLKPGGTIGIADFYVSRKYPDEGRVKHPWRTRTFWPTWFAADNVHPSPDHVPYLHRRFQCTHFSEHRATVPYLLGLKAPYYIFVGKKAADHGEPPPANPVS